MANERAIARYRETLHENLDRVQALRAGKLAAEYPQLSSYATGRSGAMFARLEELLLYFIQYGTVNESPLLMAFETSQDIEVRKDSTRGGVRVVGMYCSYEYMAAGFPKLIEGGQGKKADTENSRYSENVWKGVIARLAVLGLIWVYKPGNFIQDASEAFKQSRKRAARQAKARRGWSRPVNYYFVPKYSGSRGAFQRAERRVSIVASLGADGCKDKGLVQTALVRKLGAARAAKEADRIFCNPYERHIWRDEKEEILCAALVEELRRNGYTYPDTVLYLAEHGQEKYSLGALERIWRTHKRIILERCGVSCKRPTSAQKERWGLYSDKYILTAEGELKSDIPTLEELTAAKGPEEEPPF